MTHSAIAFGTSTPPLASSGKDRQDHGDASFVQSLVRLGLVDGYQPLVHPVVLGAGLVYSAIHLNRTLIAESPRQR
jgi:hypothetical protein